MKAAGAYMQLENPHRWLDGSPELGQWILRAREVLRDGNPIDLTGPLPEGLQVLVAQNRAQRRSGYQLSQDHRRPLDRLVNSVDDLLVLTGQNETAAALAAFWGRRIPIWEGHTREALDELVGSIGARTGDAVALSEAVAAFLGDVAVGFSPSSHGSRFVQEVAGGCSAVVRGKPAYLQELGQIILDEPNHSGVSRCLIRLAELINQQVPGFEAIKINYRREYKDATRLMDYSDASSGHAEINRRRTFTHPMPPARAISTIHKAKGLECEHAVIVPCDNQNFSSTEYARCKLYVALSRAKRSLTLVVSTINPSPLFYLG